MKFKVTRASQHHDDNSPPCEGVEQSVVLSPHRQTFPTPELRDEWIQGHQKSGSNLKNIVKHPGKDNLVEVDFVETHWVVELSTLQAFMTFIDLLIPVIITYDGATGIDGCITIYDDYVE